MMIFSASKKQVLKSVSISLNDSFNYHKYDLVLMKFKGESKVMMKFKIVKTDS
jgi:hypothetical protein